METIVALATPAGNSGVAVIRISGDKSKEILQKMIRQDLDFEPRKMYLKNVYAGDIVDRCLVVFFKNPFSFTGEDVAEIQSHGGYFLAEKIVEEAIKCGAVLAGRGEFSKRAFINGKISLDQAEGIIDLINSETEMQAHASSELMRGELTKLITSSQDELTNILAEIEAKLDYPEYDFSEKETSNLIEKIEKVRDGLNTLLSDSKTGILIKNGIKVAIVGEPNVGKSSLLNALTKSDKAIVTNIAGTTRDVVEAEYEFNGIIFRLFDTAGIHESDDVVEKIGIDRAIKTLEDCDVVVRVSSPESDCEIETDKPVVDVFNKADLSSESKKDKLMVSATTGLNLDKLKQTIFDQVVKGQVDQNKFYLTNTRHIENLKRAILCLDNVISSFSSTTLDIVSSEIKSAWQCLGEITGVVSDEEIIDRIFSKFCLGK